MKHGKKPTVKQANFMKAHKLDYTKWLVISETNLQMVVMNRKSERLRVLQKEKGLRKYENRNYPQN